MIIKSVFLASFLFFTAFISCAQVPNTAEKNISKHAKQPDFLQKGDSIYIVSPSGRLKNKQSVVNRMVLFLESWGLRVKISNLVFAQNHHFAGTDKQRASDFQKALDNPNIKAIISSRGGYGTVRILDALNYTEFKKYPKWVIGYSDITALHNQIHNQGFQSLHAMMCTSLDDDDIQPDQTLKNIASFKKALFGKELHYSIPSSKWNVPGNVTAPLVGGNLTLLHTMLGSKTSISVKGKILFIEEIGEYKYHIDRMLQSLKRAGYFEDCKGLIIGGMTKVKKNTTPWGSSVEKLIRDAVSEYDFPILFNFPTGHGKENCALLLGNTVDLKVTKKGMSTLKFH